MKRIFIITVICIFVVSGIFIAHDDGTRPKASRTDTEAFDQFHRANYCYDADGWCLYVNADTGMYELVYGTKPIAHGYVADTSDIDWLDNMTVIDVPMLVMDTQDRGGAYNTTDKSKWWFEGHTTKGVDE